MPRNGSARSLKQRPGLVIELFFADSQALAADDLRRSNQHALKGAQITQPSDRTAPLLCCSPWHWGILTAGVVVQWDMSTRDFRDANVRSHVHDSDDRKAATTSGQRDMLLRQRMSLRLQVSARFSAGFCLWLERHSHEIHYGKPHKLAV